MLAKHLLSAIGQPIDYVKNKAKGFENIDGSAYDLRIPPPNQESNQSIDELYLAEALSNVEENIMNEEEKGGEIPHANGPEEESKEVRKAVDNTSYMPIKAFSMYSTDWLIKVRIVKKSAIRNWKNERG